MMKIVIAIVLLASQMGRMYGAEEKELAKTIPTKETAFIQEKLDPGLEWLRFYSTFPEVIDGMQDNGGTKEVAKGLILLCERYLKIELIPNEAFAADHIRFVPAIKFSAPNNKEDVAFLRYRIGNYDHLIAITVGEGMQSGRFMLFIRDLRKPNEAKAVEIHEVVKLGLEMDGVVLIKMKSTCCFIVNTAINLKSRGTQPLPAHPMESDEWYKSVESGIKQKQKAEQIKERRRLGKIEYVKALIAILPDGHPNKQELWERYVEMTKLIVVEKDPKVRNDMISMRAREIETIEMCVRDIVRKPLPEGVAKGDIMKWSEEHPDLPLLDK